MVSPLILSPHNPDLIYTAAESVFKSIDHGQSWTQISQDLTRNDKSKQKPSGGPLTLDITSVEYYDTVFALAESPVKEGVLWAGTDDGLVNVSTDGGKTWANVSGKSRNGAPLALSTPHRMTPTPLTWQSIDIVSTISRPYIYKTADLANWTTIVNGIPDGAYVRAVREDPNTKACFTPDRNRCPCFIRRRRALATPSIEPAVSPIHDLVIKTTIWWLRPRAFVLGPRHLTPLRQVTAQSNQVDAILYQPQTALRLHYPTEFDKRQPVGDNRLRGQ